MSAIASMSINDGQATPVAHTFAPVNVNQDGVAFWADRASGIALGYGKISMSLREPTAQSRMYKLTAKIVTPVLEVTSPSTSTGIQPAPTKAYDLTCNVDILLPERSSLTERKNLIAYVRGMLAHANVTNAVENFEAVF